MSAVIKVENLSKQYRLGEVGTGSIVHDINRFWHRIRGKEDPYLKVGEINDRTIKGGNDYVWALKDVGFEVKHGDVLGIIGRNGAGKSTLLKILSRTTTPTTGTVKIRGRVASLLEVGTGFHPELSGRENIFLNGAILGMTKQEIRSKFDQIVDFSGVERYIDTPVKRYSSGMYVRLAFAVAAHLEPEILIVDEVLAVGDAEFQKRCLGKMREVSEKEGRTILFVSHNLDAIKRICTTGILFDKGAILRRGLIEEIYSTYVRTFKKDFMATREALDLELNENVTINKFTISKNLINSFDSITFNLEIASSSINPFTGLALLFYNFNDERVAILDLRGDELTEKSSGKKFFTIKGTIENIPFIEGDYFIGLAVGSELCSNNFFNLLLLSVNKVIRNDHLEHYPLSVLGYVNLGCDFQVY